jgi:hypothetical protein
MGDKFMYVKSLVYLEESRNKESLVIAANGGNLFQRAARILGHKHFNHSSSLLNAGGFVMVTLCVLFLMGFIWSNSGYLWAEVQNRQQSDRIIQTLTHNLIAYYPFNGNAKDESGFYQDGVIKNAILTEDRAGRADQAFDFNGKNSYIIIPKTNTLNTSGSITISCWIYPRQCRNYESWVSKVNEHECTSSWRTGFGENNNNEWGLTECHLINKQCIWTDYWITNSAIPLNTWTHIVAVADQSSRRVSLYINGKRTIQLDNLKPFEESEAPLFIGFQKDDNVFFDGKIDEVRIYNEVLGDQEVFALYNSN